MEAVIPDPEVSIAEGGIAPVGEAREAFIFKQVEQLAKKHKISLKLPISTIPQKALNLVLFGSEDASMEVDMGYEDETSTTYETDFEGVVNMVKRWFLGSSSDAIRDWAEKFMTLKTCSSCSGARLKKESLWF
jgi:excinuclease ABC subunit A